VENTARWSTHLATVRLHDDRRARCPVLTVTPGDDRWRLVVRANENLIVRDEDTREIVLLVMLKFCGDKDVLQWANSVVQTGISTKKSIRLDAPGRIALVGWTSGSRIRPCLMWAKNFHVRWVLLKKFASTISTAAMLVDLGTFVEKSGDVAKFTMEGFMVRNISPVQMWNQP
jgi:hypothetical protein